MEIDVFRGHGVKVLLPDDQAFLKIKETLTRIGVSSKKDKILYQSCHILHKRNEYAILHFKELFSLDMKPNVISEDDLGRRNTITNLLEEWGLLTIINSSITEDPITPLSQIKVLSHKEKPEWKLECKYTIGKK
jgi:hypothetical protein